jgi:DnaJ-class molecular chaperone
MSSGREDKAAGERSVCTPCRGTGTVISGLGGAMHQVTCPWCGGSGVFQRGRDAQAAPAEAPKA